MHVYEVNYGVHAMQCSMGEFLSQFTQAAKKLVIRILRVVKFKVIRLNEYC